MGGSRPQARPGRRRRSRSSPVAASWSIATKGQAGSWPAPRPAGHPPWPRPPTPRQSSAPVSGFHTSAGPTARENDRRAARSRFPAGQAPPMDYLAVPPGRSTDSARRVRARRRASYPSTRAATPRSFPSYAPFRCVSATRLLATATIRAPHPAPTIPNVVGGGRCEPASLPDAQAHGSFVVFAIVPRAPA